MKVTLSEKEFADALLSHHPNCACFDADVITVGGKRICAGCITAYPVAFVILLVFNPQGVESAVLAVFLALASQLRRLTLNYYAKLFFRGVAGVALGFGIGALLWAITTKNLPVITFILAAGVAYALVRAYSIRKTLLTHKHTAETRETWKSKERLGRKSDS